MISWTPFRKSIAVFFHTAAQLNPYFNCQIRDCSEYRKGIRAEKIDTGFKKILRAMTPSKQLLDIAMSMLKDAWDQRRDQATQAKSAIKRQIKGLDKQQDTLLERLVETSNPKVSAAFETKIAKIEEQKLLLADKLSHDAHPKSNLGVSDVSAYGSK